MRYLLIGFLVISFLSIGRIGQALNFDGVDDYVDAGSNTLFDSTKPLTTSLWAKYKGNFPDSGSNQYPGYINFKTDQATGFTVWISDEASYAGINFGSSANFVRRSTAGDISGSLPNAWKHIVITFDGVDRAAASSYRIYVDGIEQATITPSSFGAVPNVNRIGQASTASTFFLGSIDEVRVYNRALSAREVKMLYYAPWLVSRTNLVGYWPLFSVAAGAFDYSRNKNHGKLKNGPTTGPYFAGFTKYRR